MRERRVVEWSVRVLPDRPFYGGSIESDNDTCQEIAKGILRHVDGVRSATVLPDIENVCSHCGEPWTERSDTYNGGCCGADEEAAGDGKDETP